MTYVALMVSWNIEFKYAVYKISNNFGDMYFSYLANKSNAIHKKPDTFLLNQMSYVR